MEIKLSEIIITAVIGFILVYNFQRKKKLKIKASVSKNVYSFVLGLVVLIVLSYLYSKDTRLTGIAGLGLAMLWIMYTSNGITEEGIQIYKSPRVLLLQETWKDIKTITIERKEDVSLRYEGRLTYNTLHFHLEDYEKLVGIIEDNMDKKKFIIK